MFLMSFFSPLTSLSPLQSRLWLPVSATKVKIEGGSALQIFVGENLLAQGSQLVFITIMLRVNVTSSIPRFLCFHNLGSLLLHSRLANIFIY